LCAILVVQSNSRPEEIIANVLSPPPNGVRWLVDVFWIGGSFGTVAALLLLAALRRRLDVLRDLAIAAGGTLAVSVATTGLPYLCTGRPAIDRVRLGLGGLGNCGRRKSNCSTNSALRRHGSPIPASPSWPSRGFGERSRHFFTELPGASEWDESTPHRHNCHSQPC